MFLNKFKIKCYYFRYLKDRGNKMIEIFSITSLVIIVLLYIYNSKTQENKIKFDLLEDRLKYKGQI